MRSSSTSPSPIGSPLSIERLSYAVKVSRPAAPRQIVRVPASGGGVTATCWEDGPVSRWMRLPRAAQLHFQLELDVESLAHGAAREGDQRHHIAGSRAARIDDEVGVHR
jgi:hypothetical protein